MIGGFIVSGDDGKDGRDPSARSLAGQLRCHRVLADPVLELYDSTGDHIGQNDNWTSLPPGTVPAKLQPSKAAESVIADDFAAGQLHRCPAGGQRFVRQRALCELYDLAPDNSERAQHIHPWLVGTGDDVMIGGLILGGSEPTKVLIRAIGPS